MTTALRAGALALVLVFAVAPAANATPATALIAFVSPAAGQSEHAFAQTLAAMPGASLGILSATDGNFRRDQMLLDIGQGARIQTSSYTRSLPPLRVAADGTVALWARVLRRAREAPARLQPGLLAGSITSAAYAGPADGGGHQDAVVAADTRGAISSLVTVEHTRLTDTVQALTLTRPLVVADLGPGTRGQFQLRTLLARRRAGELVIAVERRGIDGGSALRWIAAAGLDPPSRTGELTSDTTNERGLVSAVDIAPTVLGHLGAPAPAEMNGRAMRAQPPLHADRLVSLTDRLNAIAGRRLGALLWIVLAWVLLLAALGWSARGRRTALRAGALGVLWAPVAVLVTAALEPGRTAEKAILAMLCLALGAVTDRLLPWPRAPLLPAAAAVGALAVDALAGTQLLARSLLGPNPAYGSRFYGIGNELKSALAVLVLAGVAAALTPGRRASRPALAFAGAGLVLAVVEGSARLGAGVGGVVLVAAGTAVATILMLPGRVNRRRLLWVLIAPVLALVVLAAIDLGTAHGTGHFSGSILHARSAGDVRDVLARRYANAWGALRNGLMPLATALALVAAAAGLRWQRRVLSPLPDPAWRAALCGGLAAGVTGALVEDSGPVLLVVATFALLCLLAYLHGRPLSAAPQRSRRVVSQT